MIRKTLGNILAMILLALTACSDNTQQQSREIQQEFRRIEAAYRTNNIHAAHEALLSFQKALEQKERKGVKGIDYDTSLAITYGRLFLIYVQLGNSNQAEGFFAKSADRFNSRRKKSGVPTENYTFDLLAQKIRKWDSISPVPWRTNGTSLDK